MRVWETPRFFAAEIKSDESGNSLSFPVLRPSLIRAANTKAGYLRRPPSERRQPEIWLKNHLWSADPKYDALTSLDHVGKPAVCEGKYAIVCS